MRSMEVCNKSDYPDNIKVSEEPVICHFRAEVKVQRAKDSVSMGKGRPRQ
jgi:hypothetical protein